LPDSMIWIRSRSMGIQFRRNPSSPIKIVSAALCAGHRCNSSRKKLAKGNWPVYSFCTDRYI